MATKRSTKKKSAPASKSAWFKPVRGSYIPIHWKGWLTYVPYIAYLYLTFIMFDRNRSILETVLFLVPYWVAGVIIMHWVAKQKS
jgi:hypothetical protein